MARMIHRDGSPRTRQVSGFSLIEVMVAVVILATGLLALAALQGALARNSADAKARSAVAAALTSRMNEYRQAPPADGTNTYTCSSGNWVCVAETQGSIGGLTVTDTITTEVWKSSDFSEYDPSADDLSKLAYFKRIEMSAAWTDAAGKSRTLSLNSDVSAKIYGNGSGYPVNDPNGSSAKYPIVRQDNPSNTAGVIPIVTGNQATAASNPQPIIEGADDNLRVGTSFDVLNYVPEGSTARITKRFQTEVIKCRCQFDAAGYSVAGKAQWPAVWDGTTYSLYPGTGDAAGVAANAGEDPDYSGDGGNGNGNGKKSSGRLQSEQCTECCRDHHDASSTAAEGKYDPEATGTGKFNESAGVLTAASSGAYVAACRVVKVDGLWRTATDMYQRHYGLLETTAASDGTQAKSGIPSSAATSAYQAFVKDYLAQYTSTSTTAPTNGQSMFDDASRGLNLPATITIAAASNSDWRYLHGRGLYVDYLGSKAQNAINKCALKTGNDYTECVLPVLPFTTVNLTEMAQWTASDPDVLNINTTKALSFDVEEPSGGRTRGINDGSASNNSAMRKSNSGVAVSDDIAGAVDSNGDETTATDSQAFQVGSGSGGNGTGDEFHIVIADGELENEPTWTIPSQSDSGECTFDGEKWTCPTDSSLAAAGTILLDSYNLVTTKNYVVNRSSCTQIGNAGTNNAPTSWTVSQDLFSDYSVASVSGGGNVTNTNVQNEGTNAESTEISLDAIPNKADGAITVTMEKEEEVPATFVSCTFQKNGNAWSVNVVWSKPWE